MLFLLKLLSCCESLQLMIWLSVATAADFTCASQIITGNAIAARAIANMSASVTAAGAVDCIANTANAASTAAI